MSTRKWARNLTTSYYYDNGGSLTNITYSDSTPNVTNVLDRLGRVVQILGGANSVLSLAYDLAGNLLSESYTAGPLAGLTVTNVYDSLLRRATNGIWNGSAWLAQSRFGYDAASRLQNVTDSLHNVSAGYSYLSNSPLVEYSYFTNGSTLAMTTTKAYDKLNRLTSVQSSVGASPVASFAYAYNSANQRTGVTNVDNSRWAYGYDNLGQVTSGKKYWSDNSAVAGEQFEYVFDDIGNRRSTKAGGDTSGANLRQAGYTVINVNEYTRRDVPGYLNILGTAATSASVYVNGQSAVRQGEYFRKELSVTNGSSPVWQAITNVALVRGNGTTNNPDVVTKITGNLLVPPFNQYFSYDYDGNMTSDSVWTNTWNAENRLVNVESASGVSTNAKVREQWTYLPDGRWVQRIVSTWNGSTYVAQSTNRYVWDGQVLLAVLDHTNGVTMSFMRGLDLSGAMQGAGGAGGVLAFTARTNGTHIFAYDGNANVMALVNATNGVVSAQYEYDAFGNLLRSTGPLATVNPIRFSTQYADDVTGDQKYLFREYVQSLGRWRSRDPIGEKGGKNLYGFVGNNPLGRIDLLGLRPGFCPCNENQKKADDFVNKAIRDAMAGATTPDQIAQKIKTQLIGGGSGKFSVITGIEKIIEDAVNANKIEGARCSCNSKANSVYLYFVPQSAASISLCGQCIGSDKLGHFFEEGLTYYEIKKANGQAYADAFGRWLEGLATPGMNQAMYDFLDGVHFINYGDSGLLFARGASYGYFGDRGLDPNGFDASPADLAANRGGQDFWDNLYAGKIDPAKFNICDYVKKEWDQTKNPNVPQDPKPSRPNR